MRHAARCASTERAVLARPADGCSISPRPAGFHCRRLKELNFTARLLSAEEALAAGFVWTRAKPKGHARARVAAGLVSRLQLHQPESDLGQRMPAGRHGGQREGGRETPNQPKKMLVHGDLAFAYEDGASVGPTHMAVRKTSRQALVGPEGEAARESPDGRSPGPAPCKLGSPKLAAMINCPKCNEENPPKFRLCGYCGAPLAAGAGPAGARGAANRHLHLLRPQGLDRPRGAPRPGGDARGEGALLHHHGRRDHQARRQDREVHRRRDHGGIRAAAAARRRRAPRGSRRGRHAGRAARRQRGPVAALRRRAGEPHGREHRRGGRQRRPDRGPEAGHRRRRQRHGAARAGGAGERDLSRRDDVPPGA